MARKQQQPRTHELKPQPTIAKAVNAAARHVANVYGAAQQQRGSSNKG
jgi:hypothetical protein